MNNHVKRSLFHILVCVLSGPSQIIDRQVLMRLRPIRIGGEVRPREATQSV